MNFQTITSSLIKLYSYLFNLNDRLDYLENYVPEKPLLRAEFITWFNEFIQSGKKKKSYYLLIQIVYL